MARAFLLFFFAFRAAISTALFAEFSLCPPSGSYHLGVGYRSGCFDWSVGGMHQVPDVLSELEWKHLQIVDFPWEVGVSYFSEYPLLAFGELGWVVEGECYDSDYLQSGRNALFSLSRSEASHSPLFSANLAVGKSFSLARLRLHFLSAVGFGYRYEKLRMHHGKQLIAKNSGSVQGLIPGLNSSYQNQWFGPLLLFRIEWASSCYRFLGETRLHFVQFYGKGWWNLRPDLPRGFTHRANGLGQRYTLGIDRSLGSNWRIGCWGFWELWKSRSGTEKLDHLCFDPSSSVSKRVLVAKQQPFNGARWEAWALSVQLSKTW